MTANFWQQRKLHQLDEFIYSKTAVLTISVPMQNMFLFEATKETQDQRKTKIAYR
jgi:hypothetical protein